MDLFAVESQMFDYQLNKIEANLIDALTVFHESVNETIYVTEKEAESLGTKVKKFISDIIVLLKNLKANIQNTIETKTREKSFRNKLDALHKELKEKKEQGIRKVQVVDVWKYTDFYLYCVEDLKKYVKKFTKVKYTRTADIDADLATFKKITDKYDEKLEKIASEKITIFVDRMLGFVEDEITGRSRVLKTLNDAITMFNEMQNEAMTLEVRKEILGPDILPKHVGFLRKIAYGFTGFIKRWVIRIMTTVILIIG